MDTDDQDTSEILAALSCLPFEKQVDSMRVALSHSIKYLSTQRLYQVRKRIELELDDTIPSVRTTLEVIDGQIALREIAEGAYWR